MSASPTLALDLGFKTGWAVAVQGRVVSATADFSRHAGNRGALFEALDGWLSDMVTDCRPGLIAFERPFFRGGGTRLLFGMAAVIELIAARRELFVCDVPNSTIKKHLTGCGKADKAGMIEACRQRGWSPADDHQADALALLDYVITNAERPAA